MTATASAPATTTAGTFYPLQQHDLPILQHRPAPPHDLNHNQNQNLHLHLPLSPMTLNHRGRAWQTMAGQQDTFRIVFPACPPPPPQSISSYSRFMHDHTKRQMQSFGGAIPSSPAAGGAMANGFSAVHF